MLKSTAGMKRVDVLTFFENGKMDPVKFRMNGRVYPIRRIKKKWRENRGATEMYHFLIESDGKNKYELHFDSRKFVWALRAVV